MDAPLSIPYRYEIARKSVHVTSAILAVAALQHWDSSPYLPALLLGVALLTVVGDGLRLKVPSVHLWFDRHAGRLMRGDEKITLTGATTMWIGFALAALMLPLPYACVGIILVAFGDGAAALVGRLWGKRKIWGRKTLEGSVACFGFGLFAASAIPGVAYWPLVLATTAVTILEAVPLDVDDNAVLPLVGGAVAWLAGMMVV